jgi:queuosine precursor transporter
MNEAIFFLQTFVALLAVLLAARMGLVWLIALLCTMLVLMNLFVLKQMDLFGMELTGGNVLYGAVFLATDLLAEHWGKRQAYRAVRIGFCVSLFAMVMGRLIVLFEPNAFDAEMGGGEALATLLTPQWRIVSASMVTYLLVQHLDVFLYEWWRRRTKGKALWLRNNGSTWVSQAADTVLFTVLAFAGMGFPIWNMIFFTYILKVSLAILDTPFLYLSKTQLFAPRDVGARASL